MSRLGARVRSAEKRMRQSREGQLDHLSEAQIQQCLDLHLMEMLVGNDEWGAVRHIAAAVTDRAAATPPQLYALALVENDDAEAKRIFREKEELCGFDEADSRYGQATDEEINAELAAVLPAELQSFSERYGLTHQEAGA